MRLIQETRLEQRLSPQLIQSLKLLQLPTLELEAMIKQELETNPLLEEIQRPEPALELTSPERNRESSQPFDEQQWREVLAHSSEVGGRGLRPDTSREFEELPQPAETSLQEHLLGQLHLAGLDPADNAVGEIIIGDIDDDGFLKVPVEDVAAQAGVLREDVLRVLAVIQTFDPSGVGARNLPESLSLQLREKGLENTVLMALVEEHLDDLEHHRYSAIAKALDIDEADVQVAVDELALLSPRPAAGRFGSGARSVVPDLVVENVDGEYVVLFNSASLPNLRISNLYREILA